MWLLFAQAADTASKAAAPAAAAAGQAAPAAAAAAPATAAPAVAPAAVAETVAQTSQFMQMLDSGLMHWMIAGGIFMWPILVLGVLAAAVIIERFRSLKMLGTNVELLRGKVRDALAEGRAEDALHACDAEQGPVPAILAAGLRKLILVRRLGYDAANTEEQVNKAMDEYGVHIVAALERHLSILATVASAAPMLGFLGTVQGMILSFADIVALDGKGSIVVAAAKGIEVALITTAFGLIVGIPAYVAYNYFTSIVNRFVLDVQESSSELMETVSVKAAIEDSRMQTAAAGGVGS